MLAASGLKEYCIGLGHCVDSLIAKALSTIDSMNSCIQVGLMMNPSLYPHSVDSRVGKGCLDSLMNLLMILRLLDYGGGKQFLLLVSIVAIASLGPEPLEELVPFPALMAGVESLL